MWTENDEDLNKPALFVETLKDLKKGVPENYFLVCLKIIVNHAYTLGNNFDA